MNQSNRNRFNFSRRTQRRPRRGRVGKNPNQRQYVGHTSTPHVPALYAPIPTEMQMSLKHRETDIRVDSTVAQSKVFGLFEFLGDIPKYSVPLYDIYRYARITAVNVKMEVVNTSAVPLTASMCVLPWTYTPQGGAAILGPNEAAEYARSVTKQIGLSTGMGKATLVKTFESFDQLGEPVYSPEFWVDATQAILSIPLNVNAPVVYCVVDSTDPTLTWSANISYTVTFHIQWFDLRRDTSDTFDDVVTVTANKVATSAKRK